MKKTTATPKKIEEPTTVPDLPNEVALTAKERDQLAAIDGRFQALAHTHSALRRKFLADEQQVLAEMSKVSAEYNARVQKIALSHGIENTPEVLAEGYSWDFSSNDNVFRKIFKPEASGLSGTPAPAPAEPKPAE